MYILMRNVRSFTFRYLLFYLSEFIILSFKLFFYIYKKISDEQVHDHFVYCITTISQTPEIKYVKFLNFLLRLLIN